MDILNPSNRVFLCAGGVNPRLEIHDLERAEVCNIFHLPAFHSIYAIDLDIEKNRLAVGTKGGLIIIYQDILSTGNGPPNVYSFIQGAPILSLCWLETGELAVSDTAGRCLLWRPDRHQPPRPLPMSTAPFCSLCNLPNGQLAGLATNGALYLWDPLEAKIVARRQVPSPPKPNALASMIYWAEPEALALPARAGNLILYHFTDNRIDILQAHEGAIYSLTTRNGHLLSIGAEDGCLKTWSGDDDQPLDVSKVPKRVVSLTITGESATRALLVDIHGNAQVFRWCQTGLVSEQFLVGKDYRLATAPTAETIKAFVRAKERRTAKRLLNQLITKKENMPTSDREDKFQQITDLGFPHTVLAIKAEQFENSGQMDKSLKMRHTLVGMLPTDDPKTYPSRLKYAANLEAVWQIQAAYDQYLKIQTDDGTVDVRQRRTQLQPVARILDNTNDWIIESDISIETIIKSNTIIGTPFHGRYVLHRMPALNCNQVILDAAMIAQKYNQIQQINGNKAVSTRPWMISRSGIKQRAMVFFEPSEKNQNPELILSWDVFQGDLETHIIPLALFVWQLVRKAKSFEQVNNTALKQIRNILIDRDLHQRIAALQKGALQVLRRILTIKLSQEQICL